MSSFTGCCCGWLLQIYNERLFDLLLHPAAAAANTDLVISNSGGTFVRGLTEVEVTSGE